MIKIHASFSGGPLRWVIYLQFTPKRHTLSFLIIHNIITLSLKFTFHFNTRNLNNNKASAMCKKISLSSSSHSSAGVPLRRGQRNHRIGLSDYDDVYKTTAPISLARCLIGGWTMSALHLILISTTVINPLSPQATGTVTVHSWLIGWLLLYHFRGGFQDRWVRIEAGILLSSLFQLAVGAFAFSRIYNGPMFGHSRDVFQTLSVQYMQEEIENLVLPNAFIHWWIESSRERFVGLGWYICEVADCMVHQVPFVFLCYIITRKNAWNAIRQEVRRLWPIALCVGVIHRTLWDYSTCGHSFCDGPYRGFLEKVTKTEQFLWHLMPCCVCVYWLCKSK